MREKTSKNDYVARKNFNYADFENLPCIFRRFDTGNDKFVRSHK